MDRMTQGKRPEHDALRSPPGKARAWWPLVLFLATGCHSAPRVLDRNLDPPPLTHPQKNQEDPASTAGGEAERGGDNGGKGGGGGSEVGSEAGSGDETEEQETWPDIKKPGPDIANFPNSAFTIPRGAFQVELAPVTLNGPTDNNGPNYNTQFLLRYGLTDRVELRLFGVGYVAVFNSPQRTTGFAPPAFDLKMNLWDESEDHLIPAVGLEVYVQSTFGSPAFRSGVQPAISLLFDHTLPCGFQFEWNVGLNGAQRPLFLNDTPNGPINLFHGPEENALEWSLQWALQRQLIGKLDVFTHGYINSAAIPTVGDGIVVGGGGVYTLNDRVSLFGSYNAGLTVDAPTTFFLLGFASAF